MDPYADGMSAYGSVFVPNFTDAFGLDVGGFNSPEQAARDFGEEYNDDSIAENREYGTSIYQEPGGTYAYKDPPSVGNPPSAGDRKSVDIDSHPNEVADAHTHGAWDDGYVKGPSDEDRAAAQEIYITEDGERVPTTEHGKERYVIEGDGSMTKYGHDPTQDTTVANDLPRDENAPPPPELGPYKNPGGGSGSGGGC